MVQGRLRRVLDSIQAHWRLMTFMQVSGVYESVVVVRGCNMFF